MIRVDQISRSGYGPRRAPERKCWHGRDVNGSSVRTASGGKRACDPCTVSLAVSFTPRFSAVRARWTYLETVLNGFVQTNVARRRAEARLDSEGASDDFSVLLRSLMMT